MTAAASSTLIHLSGLSSDVVVDVSTGVPTVVHWGAKVAAGSALQELAASVTERPLVGGSPDVVAPLSIVPEHGSGFPGRPGLLGRRGAGSAWSPRFVPTGSHLDGRRRRQCVARRRDRRPRTRDHVRLDYALAASAAADQHAPDASATSLDALYDHLAVPEHAGRTRSRSPADGPASCTRRAWAGPTVPISSRTGRGRTSHEHPPLHVRRHRRASASGTARCGAPTWRGAANHCMLRRAAARRPALHPARRAAAPGRGRARAGRVVHHARGARRATATHGLTTARWRSTGMLRARPTHPTRPRPVLLNTWEAVYFDHDSTACARSPIAAAAVGVERFVLDDGWFGSRRDDTAGWATGWCRPTSTPTGWRRSIDHVRGLGMEFGIWVEPEMVNPDSDLLPRPSRVGTRDRRVRARAGAPPARARPRPPRRLRPRPRPARRAAARPRHRLREVGHEPRPQRRARAPTVPRAPTRQTLALYRLLDELRARHPMVEIESCSSGGARIDHGILRRTDRVWTSDCNDALERQTIQRGASMLVPPELMGAHIGPTRSHTTGRVHTLAFRAATALFGHLGVEWNVLALDRHASATELAEVIALHQRFRPLLHGGDTRALRHRAAIRCARRLRPRPHRSNRVLRRHRDRDQPHATALAAARARSTAVVPGRAATAARRATWPWSHAAELDSQWRNDDRCSSCDGGSSATSHASGLGDPDPPELTWTVEIHIGLTAEPLRPTRAARDERNRNGISREVRAQDPAVSA